MFLWGCREAWRRKPKLDAFHRLSSSVGFETLYCLCSQATRKLLQALIGIDAASYFSAIYEHLSESLRTCIVDSLAVKSRGFRP